MSELALGQLKGLTVNSNKITVPSGHTLYAPGHVIQTVSGYTTTSVATTSSSWIDSNLTATITPKSSTSKILVLVVQSLYLQRSNSTYVQGGVRILRGTTPIGDSTSNMTGIYANGSGAVDSRVENTQVVVDSPATTSAITYKTQIAVNENNNGMTITAQELSKSSQIILMEIAA